ncbi:hypothetical protein RRG08_051830 [Elysia crispata]|uniref:Uncharacterized protein n=1 Tax=Elysia crispata TaxID=231223 RepID=A0AAE0ZAR3_9GAST|nr:hypothetical protein RRG08_051830 [Elysia crispata]
MGRIYKNSSHVVKALQYKARPPRILSKLVQTVLTLHICDVMLTLPGNHHHLWSSPSSRLPSALLFPKDINIRNALSPSSVWSLFAGNSLVISVFFNPVKQGIGGKNCFNANSFVLFS